MRNLLERVYSYVRRFFLQRTTLFSSPGMPSQQDYHSEQKYAAPEYRAPGALDSPQQRYPPQGMMNPQQGYPYPQQGSPQPGGMLPQQGYPPQSYHERGGMNPWVAGGLGALGGGLAGYGLGQAVGEMQPHAPDNPLPNGDENRGDVQADDLGFGSGNEDLSGVDVGGGDFGGE